jgi:hypothetical protein
MFGDKNAQLEKKTCTEDSKTGGQKTTTTHWLPPPRAMQHAVLYLHLLNL